MRPPTQFIEGIMKALEEYGATFLVLHPDERLEPGDILQWVQDTRDNIPEGEWPEDISLYTVRNYASELAEAFNQKQEEKFVVRCEQCGAPIVFVRTEMRRFTQTGPPIDGLYDYSERFQCSADDSHGVPVSVMEIFYAQNR